MASMYVFAFLSAVTLSFVLTRCVREVAKSKGWMGAPHGHHIHGHSIPRLGGVAIFVTTGAIMVALTLGARLVGVDPGFNWLPIAFLLVPGALVFLVGLCDDFRPATPVAKFIVQGAAAIILYAGGYGVFRTPLFGAHEFGWVSLPLTIIWVISISNAFNLIDGLDGLAGGSALFSTLVVFVLSLTSHNVLVSISTLVLAGSIVGFLRFNFNPATIFLGDCGSLFIGFMLSALALAGYQKTPTIVAVSIPVVSFGLPIAETILSIFRRFLLGQPLLAADRNHIHHRLLKRGLSQRQAVLTLYGVSALCGLLSLFLLYPGGGSTGVVLVVLGTVACFGVKRLGYHEFHELGRVAQRTVERKRVIANNVAIRIASEKLAAVESVFDLQATLVDAFSGNDFDGFSLNLPGEHDSRLQRRLVKWRRTDPSHLGANCHSNAATVDHQTTAEWSLMLHLTGSENQNLGSFLLYKQYSDKPLLIDVNLITAEFKNSLAAAVERVSESSRGMESRVIGASAGAGKPLFS